MNNFQYWQNEVADIPHKQNGAWVDLETGFEFDSSYDYKNDKPFKSTRIKADAKTLAYREKAKAFGGRALAGTTKQKSWAEKIRAEKLERMDVAQAVEVCDPSNLLQESKFWIEHREKSARDIAGFVSTYKALLENYNAQSCKESAGKIADEYNSLIEKWITWK